MHLSEQMESDYERVLSPKLMRHVPIIVRLDVHRMCKQIKQLAKPVDDIFVRVMALTAKQLFGRFGCAFAFTCSDEISLLIFDYAPSSVAPIYNGDVQTFCSLTASLATSYLIRNLSDAAARLRREQFKEDPTGLSPWAGRDDEYIKVYEEVATYDYSFGARVFNIPAHEIIRYFQSRQTNYYFILMQRLAQMHNIEMSGVPFKELDKKLKENGVDIKDQSVCSSPYGSAIIGHRDKLPETIPIGGGKLKMYDYAITAQPAPLFYDEPEFILNIIKEELEAHKSLWQLGGYNVEV